MTSVTFGEENDTSDLEDWDSVGLNCSRPPDLIQLYRWYCHQLYIEENKPLKEDFSMSVNFDSELQTDYRHLKETVEKTVRLISLEFFLYLKKKRFFLARRSI